MATTILTAGDDLGDDRRMRVLCWLLIVTLVIGQGGAASAVEPDIDPKAKAFLQQGLKLYSAARFEEAIEALKAGYAVDPKPEFLYALGQAERRRGNCEKAIDYYRVFLEVGPSEKQAAAVRPHIERCEKVLAEQQRNNPPIVPSAPPPSPSPVPTPTPAAALQAQPADIPSRPFYKDWVGTTLCAAGLATVAAGTVLFFKGNGALDGVEQRYDRYAAAAEDGKSQRTIGTVLLFAGGGLIAGGIIRYVLHSRSPAVPAVAAGPQGVMVAVSGGF